MMSFLIARDPARGASFDSSGDGVRWTSVTALSFIAALLILSPLWQGGTTHQAVMIIRFMVILMIGLWLVRGIQTGSLACPRLSVGPAVASFLGLALLSTCLSPYLHQSFQWLFVLLSYAAFLYLLASFLTGWHHVAKLLVAVVAVGLFEVGWSLTQGGWTGDARPSGSFFNPNFLAGYLSALSAIVLGAICYIPFSRSRWQRAHLPDRVFAIGSVTSLVLLIIVILLTGSRGGALALVGGTATVLGLRYRWKALGIVAVLVLVGFVIPNPVRDRFSAEYFVNPVGYARWHIWQGSIQAMREHPFGVGLGLYQYFSPRYMFPVEGQLMQYGRVARTAHNEYLQMGVELGVAAVLIFGWGLLALGREAQRALRLRLWRWQRGALVGVIGATAAILVHALVDSTLHSPAVAILLTFCAGIILLAARLSHPTAELMRRVPVQSGVRTATLGLIVIGGLSLEVARLGGAWIAFEAGSARVAQEDVSRAIAHYERAVAWDPGKALYHSSLAAAHFKMFHRTRSIEAASAAVLELDTAIALNPADGRLRGLLGHVYSSLASTSPVTDTESPWQREQHVARLRAAYGAYAQALEREPYSPFYRLEQAKILLRLGDEKSAEAIATKAIHLEPNFLPGRVWLAHRYIESGRTEEARRQYEEIVERRKRYAGWATNPVEERFLGADVTTLQAAFDQRPART